MYYYPNVLFLPVFKFFLRHVLYFDLESLLRELLILEDERSLVNVLVEITSHANH
jgi:hypothetical protein